MKFIKVIINKCYGGFGISNKAFVEYWKRKGIEVYTYKQTVYNFEADKAEFERVGNDCEDIFLYHTNKDLGKIIKGYPTDTIGLPEDYRTNPTLIEIIEEFKEEANTKFSYLKIVEIPDDVEWEIDEYDGIETIHEKHRQWG